MNKVQLFIAKKEIVEKSCSVCTKLRCSVKGDYRKIYPMGEEYEQRVLGCVGTKYTGRYDL